MNPINMGVIFSSEQCKELITTYSDSATPWRVNARKKISTHVIELPWYVDRIDQLMHQVNRGLKFSITGLTDQPALVRYDEDSYFDWHHDMYSGREGVYRKFSMITILSEPGSHDGGTLEFFNHGVVSTGTPPQGTVIAFPSWIQHRVTKVTRGTRYSAVAFVGGPQFR